MKRLVSFLALGVLAAIAGACAYQVLWRRPILDWGARPDEVARRLPGDEFLEAADVVATRAITIEAPPSAIWPWLIQMGPGRGGVYTYDWIENLFGLDMHSADEIVPEWQSMDVGYTWRNPQGHGMRAEIVDPERAIVMRAEDGRWVWAFVIVPEGDGTRFISRNRFVLTGGNLSRWASIYLMEPGSLVMERKMLLGIKARAEGLAARQADLARSAVPTDRPDAIMVDEPELVGTTA
jgi:hypothetical protein